MSNGITIRALALTGFATVMSTAAMPASSHAIESSFLAFNGDAAIVVDDKAVNALFASDGLHLFFGSDFIGLVDNDLHAGYGNFHDIKDQIPFPLEERGRR